MSSELNYSSTSTKRTIDMTVTEEINTNENKSPLKSVQFSKDPPLAYSPDVHSDPGSSSSSLNLSRQVSRKATELCSALAQKEKAHLLQEISSLKSELKTKDSSCAASRESAEKAEHKLTYLESTLARKDVQLKELTAAMTKLQDELKTSQHALEECKESNARLMSERADLQIGSEATIISLETKLEQRKRANKELEAELAYVQDQLSSQTQQLNTMKQNQPKVDAKGDAQEMMETYKEQMHLLRQDMQARDKLIDELRSQLAVFCDSKSKEGNKEAKQLLEQITALGTQLQHNINETSAKQHNTSELFANKSSTINENHAKNLEELGALRTTKDFLQRDLAKAEAAEKQLTQDLAKANDELENLRSQLEIQKKELGVHEQEADASHKYLSEENSKLKQRKAEMRCRVVEFERENNRLKTQLESVQKATVDSDSERETLKLTNQQLEESKAELKTVKEQLDQLRVEYAQNQTQMSSAQRLCEELKRKLDTAESDANADKTKLEMDKSALEKKVHKLTKERDSLVKACEELDLQCDQLNQLKKKYQRAAEEQNKQQDTEKNELTVARAEGRRYQQQLENALAELKRLETKNKYLLEELQETHQDYKEEVSLLAQQVKEARQAPAPSVAVPVVAAPVKAAQAHDTPILPVSAHLHQEQHQQAVTPGASGGGNFGPLNPSTEESANAKAKQEKDDQARELSNLKAQIDEFDSKKRNLENQLASLKRQLEEQQGEVRVLSQKLSTQNEKLAEMGSNEVKLTGALRDAIGKAERYKQERDTVSSSIEEIQHKLQSAKSNEKELERYRAERHSVHEELGNVVDEMRTMKAQNYETQRRADETIQQQQKLIDYLQAQVFIDGVPAQSTSCKNLKMPAIGGMLRSVSPTRHHSASSLPTEALSAHERRKLMDLEQQVNTLKRQLDDEKYSTLRRYERRPAVQHPQDPQDIVQGEREVRVFSSASTDPSDVLSLDSVSTDCGTGHAHDQGNTSQRATYHGPAQGFTSPRSSRRLPAPVPQQPVALPQSPAPSRASTKSTTSSGTMRHNIPHKWKRSLVLRPMKCSVCLDGLSFMTYALRCAECQVVVHRLSCAEAMLNTCGLPMLYTDYFLEQQKKMQAVQHTGNAVHCSKKSQKQQSRLSLHDTPSADGRMAGWVKLWRSDEPQYEQWRDAYAQMDSKLQFYHEDPSNETVQSKPFQIIDLSQQQWRIRFQRQADDQNQLVPADVPYLVEIKITPEHGLAAYRLYLMAPTLQAKQRWVNALQVATQRKQFARHKSSVRLDDVRVFLRLSAPHNLMVHCCAVLNDEVLLLACDEGLFFTNAVKPQVPFRIAGLDEVYQLEILPEVDMVVVITGRDRQLAYIHLGELKDALKSSTPGVRPTLDKDTQLCHLFACVRFQDKQCVCVADPDRVQILNFNKRMQVFTLARQVDTREPVTCMTQIESGVLLGAETFHVLQPFTGEVIPFLDTSDSSVSFACGQAAKRQEYPLDAVLVQDAAGRATGEILLIYQNFGLFVDGNGRRSRQGDIDWERSPLETVYTAPYLYVMHFESIEVFEIPKYQGIDTPLLHSRALIECAHAHVLGKGRHQADVLISSTQSSVTQLMLYNALKPSAIARNPLGVIKRKSSKDKDTDDSDESSKRSRN